MKSLFNQLTKVIIIFLFLLQGNVKARDVFLISFHEIREDAILIKNILRKNFSIPSNLIRLERKSNPCEKETNSIVQICIDKNGKLKFPTINRQILNRTLKYFWVKN